MLIHGGDAVKRIKARVAEVERGVFDAPPTSVEGLRAVIGHRAGLLEAIEQIEAMIREGDDEE